MGLVIVALFLTALYLHTTPDGKYYDKYVASEYAYWEFYSGQIHFEDPMTNMIINTYYKSNGVWVAGASSTNRHIILKPLVIGIRTVDLPTHEQDRFLPRFGFSWLCSILEDLGIISHDTYVTGRQTQ